MYPIQLLFFIPLFLSTVWSRRSFEKNMNSSKFDLLSLSTKLNSNMHSKSKFQPRGEDQETYVRYLMIL